MVASFWRASVVLAISLVPVGVVCAQTERHRAGLDDLEVGYPTSTISPSPDGETIAAERNGQLVIFSAATGAILDRVGEGFGPLWSPIGDRLAFYSMRSGSLQLWSWHSDGAVRKLTDLAGGIDPDVDTRFSGVGAKALAYAWDPRGQTIAFSSRKREVVRTGSNDGKLVLDEATPPGWTTIGICALPAFCTNTLRLLGRELVFEPIRMDENLRSHIYTIDVESLALQDLSVASGHEFHPAWNTLGDKIIAIEVPINETVSGIRQTIDASGKSQKTTIVEIDVASGRAKPLLSSGLVARFPQYSPNGDRVAFLSSDTFFGEVRLNTISLRTGAMQAIEIAGLDDFKWLDQDRVLAAVTRSGKDALVQIDLSSGKMTELYTADLTFQAWAPLKAGEVVWIDRVGKIYASRKGAVASRKIFAFPEPNLEMGASRPITWTNSVGDALSGNLLLPPGYKLGTRYPLIVDAYPLSQSTDWMHSMSGNQSWAARGYVVFRPGQRAPHVWMNAKDLEFGRKGIGPKGFDLGLDDLLSGIDQLDRLGIIDKDRMCLYGHSNGGGAVSYIITQTDQFKCAVIAAPVATNWLEWPVLQTGGRQAVEELSGGLNFDTKTSDYLDMSSVFRLYKSKTPLLIAVGDSDPSLIDAIEVYNGARAAGVEATLVRYADQGHLLTGDAMRDFWDKQMAFFDRFLRP